MTALWTYARVIGRDWVALMSGAAGLVFTLLFMFVPKAILPDWLQAGVFLAIGIACLCFTSFRAWLAEYRNRVTAEGLKLAHDALSHLFEDATQLFARPIATAAELEQWREEENVWNARAQDTVQLYFGASFRRLFSNLGPISPLNVAGSFNGVHDHRRSMLAMRRVRLEEFMAMLVARIPNDQLLSVNVAEPAAPGTPALAVRVSSAATVRPVPSGLEAMFIPDQSPYDFALSIPHGVKKAYRVGLVNRASVPISGRAILRSCRPEVGDLELGRSLRVVDGASEFTVHPGEQPGVFVEVVTEDWLLGSQREHRWRIAFDDGRAGAVLPSGHEYELEIDIVGEAPLTIRAFISPQEISGRMLFSVGTPLTPLRERQEGVKKMFEKLAREVAGGSESVASKDGSKDKE
jgi:hypothetical protein